MAGLISGRKSIFRNKAGGDRVQGVITRAGSQRFEATRHKLASLARRAVGDVSDADVIEALSRGWPATERYLKVGR